MRRNQNTLIPLDRVDRHALEGVEGEVVGAGGGVVRDVGGDGGVGVVGGKGDLD